MFTCLIAFVGVIEISPLYVCHRYPLVGKQNGRIRMCVFAHSRAVSSRLGFMTAVRDGLGRLVENNRRIFIHRGAGSQGITPYPISNNPISN